MPYKVQKPCKVCGKLYTPCSDCERDKTAFHWRTVACSVQCGMEYFRMVEEARKPKVEEKEIEVKEIVSEEIETISEENAEVVEEIVEKKSYKKKSTKMVNKEESEQID